MAAIDQLIAGGIQPVQVEPYGAAEARTMQLRDMYRQGQLTDQTRQQNELKLAEQKRAVDGSRKLSELLYANTKDGKTDYDSVYSGLAQAGHGDRALALEKERRAEMAAELTNRKQAIANAKEQHALVSNALTAVTNAAPEAKQAVHSAARSQLIAQGLIRPEDMPEVYDEATHAAAVAEGIDAEKQISAAQKVIDQAETQRHNKAGEATQAGQLTETVRHNQTGESIQQGQLERAKMPNTEAELAVVAADPKRSPEERSSADTALKRLNQSKLASRPVVNVHNTGAGGADDLTPEDYKSLGVQYALSGEMPSLGNGNGRVKTKITHAKEEFARTAGLAPRDLILARASFKGDVKSLEKFQAQRDQIVSFENTAQKNIDMFLNLASKIPDTGVPWLNVPIRMLDKKLAGAENMAAVDAARTVANNEIAKVTAGGGLGGVLSDAARHEVEAFNGRDLTFAQAKKVVQILKRDMASRHEAMDQMLGEIKGRIGNAGGTSETPAQPAAATSPRPPLSSFERK